MAFEESDNRRFTVIAAALMLAWLILLAFVSLPPLQPPRAQPETAPASTFSAARALVHLRHLAAAPHPEGAPDHSRVCAYLVAQLQSLGLSPHVQTVPTVCTRWRRPYRAATVSNVWARIPGNNPTGVLLLAAHYDSVSTGPGASDDGASVAALLETLRALQSDKNTRPGLRNDLIVLFTDAEETGLMGARAFVERAKEEKKRREEEKKTQENSVGALLAAPKPGLLAAPNTNPAPAPGLLAAPNTQHPTPNTQPLTPNTLVLNFEARGTAGASLMFETSPQNGWLVRQFARAVPQPLASSLFYAVYKRLPNDTDFTEFRAGGMGGLNFAFIDRVCHYHTSLDSLERLDPRSVQHHGDNMLGLARQLGNAEWTAIQQPDAVYFNVTRARLCIYPESWAAPFAVLATALTMAVLRLNFRANKRALRSWGVGALLVPVIGLIVVAVVGLATAALSLAAITPHSALYLDTSVLIGALLLSIGVVCLLTPYGHGRKKRDATVADARLAQEEAAANGLPDDGLAVGAWLWWLLLTWVTALALPGGSYLFLWPLIGVLAAQLLQSGLLSCASASQPYRQWIAPVCGMAGAIPAALLLIPVLFLLFATLAIGALPIAALLTALTVLLLRPQVVLAVQIVPSRPFLPSCVLISGGVGLLFFGALAMRPNAEHPQCNSIFYALDADSGQAIWASNDRKPDAWTTQFLGEHPEQGTLPAFFPVSAETFLHAPASVISLALPVVKVQADRMRNGVRELQLRLVSPRHAPILEVAVTNAEVQDASIEGRPVAGAPQGHVWSLLYFDAPAQGLTLTLHVKTSAALTLRIIDRAYGLPMPPGKPYSPRPDTMIATPASGWYQDTTLVSKTCRIPAVK